MKRFRWMRNLGFLVIFLPLTVLAGFWAGSRLSATMPVRAAEPTPEEVVHEETPAFVTKDSSVRDVVLLMLRSGERWQSVTFSGPSAYVQNSDGAVRTQWVEGAIEQDSKTGPYRFSLALHDQKDSEAVYRSISDGTTKWEVLPGTKYYVQEPLGLGLLPPSELPMVNDADHPFIPHPMSGKVGTPFADMLFPQGFAQQLAVYLSSEKLTLLGTEKVAGREAVILQYDMDANSRFVIWVDGETGILLKLRFYDVSGLKSGHWNQEIEIAGLQFDKKDNREMFTFDPAGLQEVGYREIDQAWNQIMTEQKGGQ